MCAHIIPHPKFSTIFIKRNQFRRNKPNRSQFIEELRQHDFCVDEVKNNEDSFQQHKQLCTTSPGKVIQRD